jgi:hypothetical protein
MLITQMPGFSEPTIAVFPFPWYDNYGRWMLHALKLQPDLSLKWRRHFVDDGQGRAKSEVFKVYEEARTRACEFNVGLDQRINSVVQDMEIRHSLLLKAEKEITVQQRLADEEQLMLAEAIRRNRLLPVPSKEKLVLPHWGNESELRENLYQLLCETPKLSIAQLTLQRITLIRKGEFDWSHWVSTNKGSGIKYYRDRIASGYGLSGRDHWGKTKAEVRSLLLPRANELLQHASVKKILADALSQGLRIVVWGGFVFWYEEKGTVGWIVKNVASESTSETGETLWYEGTIQSRNHGRIVVLPYIKENGERVQGHTKNAANDGKAFPRHPDEYLELPFKVLDGDLMRGLFGELRYD